MTKLYSEEEIVTVVARLTRVKLTSFVETEVVRPVQTPEGPRFRPIDLARLELLCELSDEFDLGEDTLDLVMRLVDQLHGVRAELRAVFEVIEKQQPELRNRIGEALHEVRNCEQT